MTFNSALDRITAVINGYWGRKPTWGDNRNHPHKLLMEAEEILKAQQWQPIATAPKDGHFLVAWEFTIEQELHRVVTESDLHDIDHQRIIDPGLKALGWMPLPAPPADTQQSPNHNEDLLDMVPAEGGAE